MMHGAFLSTGIYKNDGPFDVMIYINQIEELHSVPGTNEACEAHGEVIMNPVN